jgi:hypothetical protein
MIFKRVLLLIVFVLPSYFLGQSAKHFESQAVTIDFKQDPDNKNFYQLNCVTNSQDMFGTINFYNSKNQIILQLFEIEVPHAPGYHIIDVTEFPKEPIKIEIFVDDISYTKTFKL